jgi:hypothetical protein
MLPRNRMGGQGKRVRMPQSPPAAIRTSLGVTFGFTPSTGPVRRVWWDLSHSRRAGPLRTVYRGRLEPPFGGIASL